MVNVGPAAATVTVVLALLPDSDSVTVTTDGPTATPVTRPLLLTVAFAVVPDCQETLAGATKTTLFAASKAVMVNCWVAPTWIDGLAGVTVRWSIVVPIVTVIETVWPETMLAGAEPIACAVPVPSAFGTAVAARVTAPG